MSEPEFSPTKAPWRLRYNHQGSGQFVVESDEGMIAEICSQPNQISDANALSLIHISEPTRPY